MTEKENNSKEETNLTYPATFEKFSSENNNQDILPPEQKSSQWAMQRANVALEKTLMHGIFSLRSKKPDEKGYLSVGLRYHKVKIKDVKMDSKGRIFELNAKRRKIIGSLLNLIGQTSPVLDFEDKEKKAKIETIKIITPQYFMDDLKCSHTAACNIIEKDIPFIAGLIFEGEGDIVHRSEGETKSKRKIKAKLKISGNMYSYTNIDMKVGNKRFIKLKLDFTRDIVEIVAKSLFLPKRKDERTIDLHKNPHGEDIWRCLSTQMGIRRKQKNRDRLKIKTIMKYCLDLPKEANIIDRVDKADRDKKEREQKGRYRYWESIAEPFIRDLKALRAVYGFVKSYDYYKGNEKLKLEDVEGYKDSKGNHKGKISSIEEFKKLVLHYQLEDYPEKPSSNPTISGSNPTISGSNPTISGSNPTISGTPSS